MGITNDSLITWQLFGITALFITLPSLTLLDLARVRGIVPLELARGPILTPRARLDVKHWLGIEAGYSEMIGTVEVS
jgi:hypothetical protein